MQIGLLPVCSNLDPTHHPVVCLSSAGAAAMREQSDAPPESVTAGNGSSGETPEAFLLQAHLHEVHAILRKQVPPSRGSPCLHAVGAAAMRCCSRASGARPRYPLPCSPAPQSKENLDLKTRVSKAEGELTVLREELRRSRDETGRLHEELGRKTASHHSELDRRDAAHQRGDICAVHAASIFCTRPCKHMCVVRARAVSSLNLYICQRIALYVNVLYDAVHSHRAHALAHTCAHLHTQRQTDTHTHTYAHHTHTHCRDVCMHMHCVCTNTTTLPARASEHASEKTEGAALGDGSPVCCVWARGRASLSLTLPVPWYIQNWQSLRSKGPKLQSLIK